MSDLRKWRPRADPAYLAHWLRAPRIGQSPARSACAIEHYQPARSWAWHDLAIAIILVAALAIIIITWGA